MSSQLITALSPEVIREHGITLEEYEKIVHSLGREPNLTELGIFSVMWSEHCSYKSSRIHLRRLPTKNQRVLQGPGENAGIIDIGDGWACAFKIESHNHPAYVEPFQGAATGVGGILRDIFTMGARPLAVMDSLRFGPIQQAPGTGRNPLRRGEWRDDSCSAVHKNHAILEGVVSGIASYGNCFGVPNLGGETRFEDCYSGNPLVNAFALGIVRRDEIFYARASGEGNPVIYVGAKTGRDGIHGATMASEEFKEGSEQKRPNVQVGDPFLEKLLLEACLEAMQTGAVVGIQDMGAAGLTCSTCEMGARGHVGIEIELDLVPQRETGMTPYEIMLSESQERMLLVAEKGREQEVFTVFERWGLDAVTIGRVTDNVRLRVLQHGQVVADIPNLALTDEAPLYQRPLKEWSISFEAPPALKPRRSSDLKADLEKLLASANICSKRWIYEQYDSMVQTNTVEGPGAEAGVMRVKGTSRGLAMALDGNGRWCYLDPKKGAMHAVAEAARKVACTGATPIAATNCLNFGNPEKPEIMGQFSAVIDGLAAACTELNTPITGGNVSFYNETLGEGIYPTPVVGIVGLIENIDRATSLHFKKLGRDVVLLQPSSDASAMDTEFGSSEYANSILHSLWGKLPALDLKAEAALQKCTLDLIAEGVIESAHDISDGGVAVALAECCFANDIGVAATLRSDQDLPELALFGETASRILLSCASTDTENIKRIAVRYGLAAHKIGNTQPDYLTISLNDRPVIKARVSELKTIYETALQKALHTEAPEHLVPELLQKS